MTGISTMGRGAIASMALFCALAACDGGERPEPAAEPSRSAGVRPRAIELVGGVGYRADEPFVSRRPTSDMRAAEFIVRDHPEAVLAVFHFGPDQGGGGDVRENIQRWVEQFRSDRPGAPAPEPLVERRVVHELRVTTVEVAGTFAGIRGTGPNAPRPGWRMLGAIVEADRGLVFFKLTGPRAAVDLAEDSFRRLIDTLHPA